MRDSLYGFDELVENISSNEFIIVSIVLMFFILIIGLILKDQKKILKKI
jgi:hypothetical protein|tara:strand:+ start:626 stop:772 length:147 start_codon:yes stop_codon:yes gene_type:complete